MECGEKGERVGRKRTMIRKEWRGKQGAYDTCRLQKRLTARHIEGGD